MKRTIVTILWTALVMMGCSKSTDETRSTASTPAAPEPFAPPSPPVGRPAPAVQPPASATSAQPGSAAAVPPPSSPEEARTAAKELHAQAMKALAAKQFAEAERLWTEAASVDPSWSWPPYNLACTAALQGRAAQAMTQLRAMLQRSPDVDILLRLESDRDLSSLRGSAEFQKLVDEIARVALGRVGALSEGEDDGHATCASFSFGSDGRYVYNCEACCRYEGTYSYAKGRVVLRIASMQVEEAEGLGAARPIDVRAALRLERSRGEVCFEEVSSTGVEDLPWSPLPTGCWREAP